MLNWQIKVAKFGIGKEFFGHVVVFTCVLNAFIVIFSKFSTLFHMFLLVCLQLVKNLLQCPFFISIGTEPHFSGTS
jgi:hypothetical protein